MRGGDSKMKWLAKFIKEDSGATAVEYGIMVAAIAAVIIGIVILIGTRVNSAFDTVEKAMIPLTAS
jgi:pilus assembly protein Flp/PilA